MSQSLSNLHMYDINIVSTNTLYEGREKDTKAKSVIFLFYKLNQQLYLVCNTNYTVIQEEHGLLFIKRILLKR